MQTPSNPNPNSQQIPISWRPNEQGVVPTPTVRIPIAWPVNNSATPIASSHASPLVSQSNSGHSSPAPQPYSPNMYFSNSVQVPTQQNHSQSGMNSSVYSPYSAQNQQNSFAPMYSNNAFVASQSSSYAPSHPSPLAYDDYPSYFFSSQPQQVNHPPQYNSESPSFLFETRPPVDEPTIASSEDSNSSNATDMDMNSSVSALADTQASPFDTPNPPTSQQFSLDSDGKEVDSSMLELKEKISHGAFGHVYKGELNSEPVAVKIIYGNSFDKEWKSMRNLHHRNVVKAYCFMRGTSFRGIVMELMDCTLKDCLMNGPGGTQQPLSMHMGLFFALETVKGLQYLHDNDKVHNDLKPLNVLVRYPAGEKKKIEVKLSDFGSARTRGTTAQSTESSGGYTAAYVAPEHLKCKPYNYKVDVYSFGVLLNELFSYKAPFPYQNATQIVFGIAAGNRPNLAPNLPEELTELILRCWAEDPEHRPNMDEIRFVLRRLNDNAEQISKQLRFEFQQTRTELVVSEDGFKATRTKTGDQYESAIGTLAMTGGVHVWEVTVKRCTEDSMMEIGVCIGEKKQRWTLTRMFQGEEPRFAQDDVIGVKLDLSPHSESRGQLSFFKNGEALAVIRNVLPPPNGGALYAGVWIMNVNDELEMRTGDRLHESAENVRTYAHKYWEREMEDED